MGRIMSSIPGNFGSEHEPNEEDTESRTETSAGEANFALPTADDEEESNDDSGKGSSKSSSSQFDIADQLGASNDLLRALRGDDDPDDVWSFLFNKLKFFSAQLQ